MKGRYVSFIRCNVLYNAHACVPPLNLAPSPPPLPLRYQHAHTHTRARVRTHTHARSALITACIANLFAAFKGNENAKLMTTPGIKVRVRVKERDGCGVACSFCMTRVCLV
jgi:hypothetical protein